MAIENTGKNRLDFNQEGNNLFFPKQKSFEHLCSLCKLKKNLNCILNFTENLTKSRK